MSEARRPPEGSGAREKLARILAERGLRLEPLSFSQQRLWFLDQLEGTAGYSLQQLVLLSGELSVAALAWALGQEVSRQEALRTVFPPTDGEPFQLALPAGRVPLPVVDGSALPPAVRERLVLDFAHRAIRRPFDLGRGPLLRVFLLRCDVQEHALLLHLHHVVGDGWTMEVLAREIGELYRARLAGREPSLPDLPMSYGDFSRWQRQRLEGGRRDELLAFWTRALADAPPRLELPVDHPRPAAPSGRGAVLALDLPATLYGRVERLGRACGATSFLTFLAAFDALLWRWTGERDLLVGVPVAGRPRPELERLAGFFVNSVVLRARVVGDPAFDEWIRATAGPAIAAFDHQDLPFEELVEVLKPERQLAFAPLFQVAFQVQSEPVPALTLPGVSSRRIDLDPGTATLDLSVYLEAGPDRLLTYVQYATDLFDEATVARLVRAFETLLAGAIAQPTTNLSRLPLLAAAERLQLIAESTAAAGPPGGDVLAAILERAQLQAGAVAVAGGGEVVSYGELVRRADLLAGALARHGVGPEVVVGVGLPRSVDQVICLLAILRAGGVYLPLDPDYPLERRQAMVEDAGAALVLVRDEERQGLAAAWGSEVPLLDPAALERQGGEPPALGWHPSSAVAVLFTSGSTGRPKGVVLARGGLAEHCREVVRRYELEPGSVVLQFAATGFDTALEQALPALAAGARVELRDAEVWSAEELARQLGTRGVTVANLPTAYFQEICAHWVAVGTQVPAALRLLIVGGEALGAEAVRRFRQLAPAGRPRLFNAYGPTETTVTATLFDAAASEPEAGAQRVAVGRPLGGRSAHLLDSRLEPVLPGGPGEIWLGGCGVARGYAGRSGATADRFRPDPFAPSPGARIYRTGDLGRRRNDGALEVLGRADRQVKLRGFRIEPGEVEAELLRIAGVRQAAVLVREDVPGERRLVAYAAGVSGLDGEASLAALAQRLPAYLVPAQVVVLERLPLTPNGKVDLKALPAPVQETDRGDRGGFAGPVPELLARTWEELLGAASVGPRDDFFKLGGHSLLATRLTARVRRVFGVELPVREIFETPRLSELARRIEQRLATGGGQVEPLSKVVPTPAGDALSFAQERLWFLDRLVPGSALYNIAGALHLEGRLEVAALAASLAALVRRHPSLRTTFPAASSSARQVVSPVASCVLPVVDLGSLPEAVRLKAARKLASAAARSSFDLGRGPLFRATLLRLATARHQLVAVFHHIVSDGWSQGIFFRDLGRCYAAALAGQPLAAEETAFTYVDYAAWQRKRLSGPRLEELLAFWRERLAPPLAPLELPTDRLRPAERGQAGAQRAFGLGASRVAALRRLAARGGATLFMVLAAGLEALLLRLTGSRDLRLGAPMANRGLAEVEDVIGFFVNTLVLRVRPRAGASFAALLEETREAVLGGYAHQELPFERLVAELAPERDLARTPLFDVMITLQEAAAARLELPGLEVGLEALDTGTAKFDLTVYLREAGAGLEGAIEYDAELFDGATIGRFGRWFDTLLAAAAEEPGRALEALPLLAAAEAHQIQLEWNDTARPYPASATLHGLIEAQADRTPEAVAVMLADGGSEGPRELTYAALDAAANRLAHRLLALGVGPEVRVGVAMERSLELMVALLAVLKAGGAYVPLDPEYPAERLEHFVADSRLPVLLTQPHLEAQLPPTEAVVLAMDRGLEVVAMEAATRPAVDVAAEGLAYVIYTSGSTGKPKGAMNRHAGIVNRLLWMQEAYGLGPADRVLQKTPMSFDVSVWEFFWPLLVGARVVMAKPGGHRDPSYLAKAITASAATTLHFVPSMLQLFLAAPEAGTCTTVRRVMVSGEALPADLAARFHQRLDAELHNLYGPTEAAVDVTFWACRPGATDRNVPIGRPISNTRLQLFDRAFRACAIGVPGQLYLAGANLGRGYLGRPGLTAERFVPDPSPAAPGGRMYATGDRCRLRPDGAVDFLGRIDFQVKLRGLRIELGEIDAALSALPQVREAVTIVVGTGKDARLVSYLVPASGAGEDELAPEVLRSALKRSLPEAVVPGVFVRLAALPLSPSGKVERRALPAPPQPAASHRRAEPVVGLVGKIAAIWCDLLGVEVVEPDDSFFALGGHSLLLIELQQRLRRDLGHEVELVELFRRPTVRAQADLLAGTAAAGVARAGTSRGGAGRVSAGRSGAIAILAATGRFPGAADVEQLWRNLCAGVESISFFTPDELELSPLLGADPTDPAYVRAGGIVEGADEFDAELFGYTPREAEILDPQQRLFLECSWQALEQAGYDPRRFAGRIGVYAGAGMPSYLLTHLLANPQAMAAAGGYAVSLANDKDFLATRVAYQLGLHGPAISVQTACSTSLVAIHLACRALRDGEAEMMLAGGVTVRMPQKTGYGWEPSMILSPDGHCRPFDAAARGTVGGNGAAVVLLKPLEQALADGDRVIAVIRGSAVNNDGEDKVGFTAPGVAGQARVVAEALADAGVGADSIGYVEAHGTGTELGDPIEVAALSEVFRRDTDRRGFCGLGSIKSNLGHLDAAAGAAGLIKAALALERRYLPPSLHFEQPNARIDFANSPFYVVAAGQPWEVEGPRRAGVSSFGIGGTNAHVVLEEPPPQAESGPGRPVELIVLSARTPSALEMATAELGRHLAEHPEQKLADVAFTLQVGRRRFPWRRAVVGADREELVAALGSADPKLLPTVQQAAVGRPVAFLFPGQGSQYPGMGRELYAAEPVYRREVDRCCERLVGPLGFDLRQVLFADPGSTTAAEELRQTRIAQPALFVTSWALAKLWQSFGIEPKAMLGHSVGEWVAAALAGVFSLDDALALVALRAKLMQEQPVGGMSAVALGEAEVAPYLGQGVEVAAVNGPEATVLAGPEAALAAVETVLAASGVEARRLHTSHAFHTAAMEGALAPFAAAVAAVERSAPRIPFASNVSGAFIDAEEATDPAYWAAHLRRPVRFAAGVARLLEDPDLFLLEVGPGRTLISLARQQDARRASTASLPGPRRETPDNVALARTLGLLWQAGVEIDWQAFAAPWNRRRVQLPTYAFERRRYRVEPSQVAAPVAAPQGPERWFWLPSWRPTVAAELAIAQPAVDEPGDFWLLFADSGGVAQALADRVAERGGKAVLVVPGGEFAVQGDDRFTLPPTEVESYRRLFARLPGVPRQIVHLWGFGSAGRRPLEPTFFSLLALARALAPKLERATTKLLIAASGLFRVDGRDPLDPAKATMSGLGRVLQQEHPEIAVRLLDLPWPGTSAGAHADVLLAEASLPAPGVAVARRGGRRWVEELEPLVLPLPDGRPVRLKEKGVYLITGGLGSVSLVLAEELARGASARLVLVGRSSFPPRERWEAEIAQRDDADAVAKKLRRVQALEAMGAEVSIMTADVSDETAMAAVLAAVEARFGGLDGVIHAAGVVGEQAAVTIAELDRERAESQLRAKIEGLAVLDRLLAARPGGRELDFLFVTSSTSALLGGLGFGAYAAANAFTDAFVAGHMHAGRWVAIGWDGWTFEAGPTQAGAARAMRPEEGAAAFRRLLAMPPSELAARVLVSPRSLPAEMAVWLDVETLRRQASGPAREGGGTRPELGTTYRPPATAEEQRLAVLWSELLGVSPIGADDDFFELGGHSLLATRLLGRLRKSLGVTLKLMDVFEAPTVAGLAERLRAASATATTPEPESPIERRPNVGPRPLSFAQERMWFLYRLDPEGIAYNLPAAIRLKGGLDAAALERTYAEVARRHEILRTGFREIDGRPAQQVLPAGRVALPVMDLERLDRAAREAAWLRAAREAGRRPFRLEAGDVFRNVLLRLAADEHVFVSACHHIVTDGWSGGLSVAEIAALYPGFAAGEPAALPALPCQYADFAEWQREQLQGELLERLASYWRGRLEPLPPPLELPADRPRQYGRAPAGRANLEVSAATSEALRALARREDASLFMIAMAAFLVWLHRLSGAPDLVVGTPVASRHVPGTEGLLGMFINTLVVRGEFAGDPSFSSFLGQVRQRSLEAFAHQDMPYDKLVEVLHPQRGVVERGLFRAMLAFNHEPSVPPSLPGLTLEVLDLSSREDEAMFDLAMGLTDEGAALSASVQFDAALFDTTTVTRWLASFTVLLEGLAGRVQQPVSRLPLLRVSERHQLEWEWSFPLTVDPELGRTLERARPGSAGRRWVLVGERGELLPIGAVGHPALLSEMVEGTRPDVILGLEARFSVTGALTHREPISASRPAAGPAGAEDRWHEVEGRMSKLSQRQQEQLRRRLSGKKPASAVAVAGGEPESALPRDLLVRIQPHGDRPPLVCVHAIGGDVTPYVELAERLGPEQPFYGIQAPGLASAAAPAETVEAMATLYLEVLRSVQPEGPYVVGGWSMGAVVGFEMARQLRRAGDEVAMLLLLEPSVPGPVQLAPEQRAKESLRHDVESLLGRRLPADLGELDALGVEEALKRLLRPSLEAIGKGDLPHRLLEIYERHLLALQNYLPEPFEVPAVLVTVRDQPAVVSPEVIELWRRLLGPGLETRQVAGNHTTMLREPNVDLLAELIRDCLAAALGQRSEHTS